MLALLGLDRAIAAGEGPAQFEGSATGVWGAPLRLKARLSGAGLDAEAQGTAEPWAPEPKANVNLKVRSVNLAPLFDLKPSDALAQNISLSSRVSLAGNKLTFDDLDSAMPGSRLRGRMALTLDDERNVEGEVGLDTLDLAPAFALAIGSAGHDAAEPLGAGLLKGWRGRVAFQALRGALPGGGELRPVSGTVKSDGQSLTFDAIKGAIGGGEATANIDAKPAANGIALNARVQLSGVDGAALRYRALAMPAGRASMQMTLASQGRSASALAGALSGSGIVTLESARIAGLDPRAFDVAIRASDDGQATDDAKLRQIVEPVLSAGALPVASAQIPFNIRDGRLRVGATTLDADGARAIISGGYDIPADQADIRANLASTAADLRPAVRKFNCSRRARPTRSIAPSTWRRCRHGWRCGRSIAKPAGWIRSSAASGRRHCRLRFRRRRRAACSRTGQRAPVPAGQPLPTFRLRADCAEAQSERAASAGWRRRLPMRPLSASRWRRCRRRSRFVPLPAPATAARSRGRRWC